MKDLNELKGASGQHLITQANKLVEARYEITKNEQLILNAMISFINPEDGDFLTYKTSISQFAELLGVDKKSNKREMKTVIRRLLSRVIELETTNGWKMYQWISYAEANEKEDSLVLRFHNNLKPYLLNLKKQFTSYRMLEIVELKSIYSIRMYQILRDYYGRRQETFTYTLENFRQIVLGSGSKKYPQFKYFRTYVLNVSQKELDKKASLSFTFETIRVGRSIGEIKFTIVKKNKNSKNIQGLGSPIPQVIPQILKDYGAYGVTHDKAQAFYDKRGEQALQNTLDYFKKELENGKKLKNKGAYLFTLLKANAGQEIEVERKEAEKREQERLKEIRKKQKQQGQEKLMKAEKKYLKAVKDKYLSVITSSQKHSIFQKLKDQYTKKHGDISHIKDLESPYLMASLNKIIEDLPQYKENKEEAIKQYLDA